MHKNYLKIKELRKQGKTYGEIAMRFNLTSERIRQIANSIEIPKKRELKKLFSKDIEKLKGNNLQKEIEKLSEKDRRMPIVLKRKILVRRLRDFYGFSFPQIAKFLKRDHTSIINLYGSK